MDGVRVTGQRVSRGRCAYCLEDIVEEVEPCAGCGLLTHDACRLELGRCPTLGCGTPEAAPIRVEVDAARARPQRGPLAWLGPYLQLAFAPGILVGPTAFMSWLSYQILSGVRPGEWLCLSPWLLITLLLVIGFLLSIAQSAQRLDHFHRLLNHDQPTPMRMLLTEPGLRFTLILQPIGGGPQIVYRNPSLPRWVNARGGRQVWVHGVGHGGPYVLEFDDGRLALL